MGKGNIGFDADDNAIIGAIQSGVMPEKIDVKPHDFTTKPVYLVPDRRFEETLVIHSLSGFADYINEKVDVGTRQEIEGGGIFVQVVDEVSVRLANTIHDARDDRFIPVRAEADPPSIRYDTWVSLEDFVIQVQARFENTSDKDDLLAVLGNIATEENVERADDGVTQSVVVKSGIKRREAAIKNPVTLQPFRTFPEVEQPPSPFIVRLKKDEKDNVFASIFEADGGKWRNDARLAIKQWLLDNIKEPSIPVLA